MEIDYLLNWAKRARSDLQSYAADARAAGSPQLKTEALLDELTDILADRPLWKYDALSAPSETTLLDQL